MRRISLLMNRIDRLFCEVVFKLNLLSRKQMVECIHHQNQKSRSSSLQNIALEKGMLSLDQVEQVTSHIKRIVEHKRGPKPNRGVESWGAMREEPIVKNDPRAATNPPILTETANPSRNRMTQETHRRPIIQSQVCDQVSSPCPLGAEVMGQFRGEPTEPKPESHHFSPSARVSALSIPPVDHCFEPEIPLIRQDQTPSDSSFDPVLFDRQQEQEVEFDPIESDSFVQLDFRHDPCLDPMRQPIEPQVEAIHSRGRDTVDVKVRIPRSKTGMKTHSSPPPHQGAVSQLQSLSPRVQVAASKDDQHRVTSDQKEPFLHRALRLAKERNASDLHCHSGRPLMIRVDGELQFLHDETEISPQVSEKIIAQIMNDEQWGALACRGEVDFAYTIPDGSRYRANSFRHRRGIDIVFRLIPAEIPSLESLKLPAILEGLVDFRTGIVLCTGPMGCGKSTTLAALLSRLTEKRREHVLTIENPIEHLLPSHLSHVNQRQVGAHTGSFSRALRAALREDPDVIVIAELRDYETISLALSAAETGHLVLGTLHTGGATQTINRIISSFSSDEQAQARVMLSESLRAVVSQRLIKCAKAPGRVPALELLMVTLAVSSAIREGRTFQIPSMMQTGRAQGMIMLDDSIEQLLNNGIIDKSHARRVANNKERFV